MYIVATMKRAMLCLMSLALCALMTIGADGIAGTTTNSVFCVTVDAPTGNGNLVEGENGGMTVELLVNYAGMLDIYLGFDLDKYCTISIEPYALCLYGGYFDPDGVYS